MNVKIGKKQEEPQNYRINFLYYKRARDAMFDVVNELCKQGYKDIYIPGYIGWSPKEGSGIFDPLEAINGLKRHYYRMDWNLHIDRMRLVAQIKRHSILLLVNYFGFRDPAIHDIIAYAHSNDCIVIEDNAHGFYTYFCHGSVGSDMTFFSLHKMFPFSQGGGLLIENGDFTHLHNLEEPVNCDPFKYNYNEISKKRTENYLKLLHLTANKEDFFVPFRGEEYLAENVPQTFPILINKGDRNKIYEIMNEAGYGVVSLYHTMIEELRNDEHGDALWLSGKIMNLPVHQDVEDQLYVDLVYMLIEACKESS